MTSLAADTAPPPRAGHERNWDAFAVVADDGSARMDLAVEGITCAACMPTIEHGLRRLDGVAHARVNLTAHRLTVGWDPRRTDANSIVARLARLGYRAHPFDPGRVNDEDVAQSRQLMRALAVAGFASMNVMLLSVSVWAGNVSDIEPSTRDLFHWISAAIALPAAAYSGRTFFRSALAALRAGRTNMDVPISIGIVLTLGVSLWQTMRSADHAYFDSAVMLLFFLLAGRFLDHDMRRRTRSVAENVAALRVASAERVLDDGRSEDVPLSRLAAGDSVAVAAGDRIPVDGVITAGVSDVDQSLITGETAPARLATGDPVYQGMLNLTGRLVVRVTAAATGTVLDEVNRLLDSAAQAKSSYMRLSDRVARLYAPVVHLTALVTFFAWLAAGLHASEALLIAVAVLIITCPCALALAVPAVQVVCAGVLFRKGVLIHSGDAIERLAAVDTIVFDKTGTLTLPEPAADLSALSPDDRLRAARLGAASRHPLSRAIARAGRDVVPAPDAREVAGAGVEAMLDGMPCRLGSPAFCAVPEVAEQAGLAAHPGASLVAFRAGDAAPVLIPVTQALRPDAPAVIAGLKQAGYRVDILSGDRAEAVAEIGRRLGIADAASGMTPTGKIARLEALKAAGRTVLMVGDGLNDAPALAAAHVSLSPASAVDLAQTAADAIFLGDNLAPVAHALRAARAAKQAMAQNLWFSIVYNLVAVPVAVAGLVTPLIAALAMSGSSIIVTLNALRLRFGRED